MNDLVYFWGILVGSMILIVSWAIENNLVYFRGILAGSVIVIVSWAIENNDFAQVRNNCFHVDNMKELFQDIHIDSIMTFLRQINLFNKI